MSGVVRPVLPWSMRHSDAERGERFRAMAGHPPQLASSEKQSKSCRWCRSPQQPFPDRALEKRNASRANSRRGFSWARCGTRGTDACFASHDGYGAAIHGFPINCTPLNTAPLNAPKTLPFATFLWSMAKPVTSKSLSTPARSRSFTLFSALLLP